MLLLSIYIYIHRSYHLCPFFPPSPVVPTSPLSQSFLPPLFVATLISYHIAVYTLSSSMLSMFQSLSMKGLAAVSKVDLSRIPLTVRHLDLSSVSGLDDTVFTTYFARAQRYSTSLSVSSLGSSSQIFTVVGCL